MKALVVDDDVVSRMALVDLMEGFDDLEVIEATDGGWIVVDPVEASAMMIRKNEG
jgi:CheY-like chemotaxis protein